MTTDNTHKQRPLTSKKGIIIATFAVLIFILCLTWMSDFIHHRHTDTISQQAITAYDQLAASNQPLTFKRLFSVLSLVQKAQTDLDDDQLRLVVASINLDDQQRQKINNIAQTLTQKLFLPLLSNRLEQAISANLKNTQLLYPLLTTYLMLGNPKVLQINTIVNVAKYFIPSASQPIFKQTLIAATKAPFQGLSLQQGLIDAARNSINSLPIDQQAFLVLQNEDLHNNEVLSGLKWFKPGSLTIPNIYLRNSLQNATDNLIPTATNSVLFGNLTLGARQNSNLNPSDVSRLLYNVYLQRYSQYWLKILGWLTIKPVNNLQQMQALLTNFSGNNSELSRVLQVIHQNTDLTTLAYVSKPLAAFNSLFDQQAQALLALKLKLADVNANLQQQSDAQRLQWVKQQIEIGDYDPIKLSFALPAPLNQWLKQLSNRYWALNVKAVANNINQQWQTQIYSVYQAQFFEHFPFASNEFPDANAAQFNAFFKPGGTLDAFIKQHLTLFVDTQSTPWQWRSFPGFNAQNNKELQSVYTLAQLGKLWFEQGKAQVDFNLMPIYLANSIKQSVVNINEKLLISNQDNLNVDSNMQWNFASEAKATVTFLDKNNQIATEKQQGPWAWLRILSNNQLFSNRGNTIVKLTIGSLQADYEIKNDQFYTPQLAKALRTVQLNKALLP